MDGQSTNARALSLRDNGRHIGTCAKRSLAVSSTEQ